jgi:UDP-N-acetylmuramoyl-tripeptide--D-alanyl-D-alanine ligase
MLSRSDLLSIPHVHSQHFPEELLQVSTDSRLVQEGHLFFALRGEKHDAHGFVKDVLTKGASACVVDAAWWAKNQEEFNEAPLLVVEDTTFALGHLARVYRRKFNIPVIAIGGSNGKTSTKEMTAAVLEAQYRVLKTEGNYNNHIGVPLTLFRLRPEHEVAVIEIGTNHFGELTYLCELLEPTHGLLTNIGQEHLEFFHDLNGVAQAEGELFDYLSEADRIAFVNIDDAFLPQMAQSISTKVTYGFSEKAKVKGSVKEFSQAGQALLSLQYQKENLDIQLRVPGLHSATNALAAAAVGLHLGVPLPAIQQVLSLFSSGQKRMEVLEARGFTILNDCYNANPDSMKAALRTLGAINSPYKKLAVIGNMAELGSQEVELHRELVDEVRKSGIDQVFTFGELAQHTTSALSEAGLKARHFGDKQELADHLLSVARPGDVILIKGSRSVALEDITSVLMSEPKAD